MPLPIYKPQPNRSRAGRPVPVAGATCFAGVVPVVGACAVLLIVLSAGCASWKDTPGGDGDKTSIPRLPDAKIPDQSSVIDVAFLKIPAVSQHETSRLPWDAMDEAVIPIEVRERFEANGFRVGRVVAFDATQLPTVSEDDLENSPSVSLTSDFDRRRRRLTCRNGQAYTLVPRRPTSGSVAILLQMEKGVEGRSVRNPQFNFGLQTMSLDDGRVSVKLTPEIHHGEVKQNYVSNDSLAFRLDFSRDIWVLQALGLEVALTEGQAVVVVPQDEPFGLAKQMLVGRGADQVEERTAVIVHLSRRPRQTVDGSALR